MSGGEEGAFKAVELGEQLQSTPQATPPDPATQPAGMTESGSPSMPSSGAAGGRWVSAVDQFKLRKFFVLRPGTLEHALEDIKVLVKQEEDGNVQSAWLMAELDHWNNELERVVLITDNTLLICKYDFMMLNCEQIQRIPLNYVDRIVHGNFGFPPRSLLKREGEGLRVYWDRTREPTFSSRWNPFAKDYPFCTFTYHPVRSADAKFAALCEIHNFREQLNQAAQRAHAKSPVPGKANGVLVLNQPIIIDAYVGLMSFIGNQNKLGYCLARGNIGF
ncbi:tumor protein p63-regulated gene 1 protein [Megalops cyprinoides]|uniref:tumor protein p63-regulated gene 1 protein n=1 Tax=Megalops cyprinoides TaxID=118141 RepID=UPI001863C5BB|nr:tumor protein p63-regulated gene 1 protein [Megalops cyprinoides]XP_036411237.1 tumor protein p63-regulated gene 1 protein [Megalops cyprinoides]